MLARNSSQVLDENITPENQGGYLQPGQWQVSVGYRHQFSYQHFVGDVYQEYRKQQGNEVQNRVNLLNFDLTYQWTHRFSLEFSLPLLFASRQTENSPIRYQSSGIGDIVIVGNAWVLDPTKHHNGNVQGGVGILFPSGNDDVLNTTTPVGSTTQVTAPVDYSIQPGNGGWGLVMQWQGFHTLKNVVVYTDGDYIATEGGNNGVQRGTTLSTTTPLNNYVAIQDQYLWEAGVSVPLPYEKTKGLSLTFGPRWEGVPSRNWFGDNSGFRRPGYAVTLGPGFQYSRHNNILTGGVYKAVHRDRTTSFPDDTYHTHGDAAFANWVWLASWTYRF